MLLSDILYYMKDLDSINREREGRANLSQYKDLIETISKVEYKKFSNLGLIDLTEVISLANYTVYYLVNNSKNKDLYNTAYLTKAVKWAIRNEMLQVVCNEKSGKCRAGKD